MRTAGFLNRLRFFAFLLSLAGFAFALFVSLLGFVALASLAFGFGVLGAALMAVFTFLLLIQPLSED